MLYFNFVKGELSLQQLLIALFLFITAPITAHMLIKAALHLKLKTSTQTSGKQNADL
jgi:multicomponent K+:H+ antiporter subunit G